MSTTINPDFVVEPSAPQTPERKLWTACLLTGIQEAFEARRQRIQRNGVRMNLDESWLFDPKPHHVGSFNWICYQLGMEPELLRERSLRNLPPDAQLHRKAQPVMFEKDERHRALLEWMHERGENVTVQIAADAFKVDRTTILTWFSKLLAERRVMRFTRNRRLYYTLTQSEIKRRKQWR